MNSRQHLRDWGLGIRDWRLDYRNPFVCLRVLRGEKSPRRGFTIVELLVVLLILAILAGLIATAAIPAVRAVRRMVILGEITELHMAMERYKQEHEEYPPDFCGVNDDDNTIRKEARDTVIRHLRRAFPQYQPGISGGGGGDDWERFKNDVLAGTNNVLDVEKMTPAGALVFWLGGLPSDGSSSTKLTPMSANPANPFDESGSRLKPFFEFDESRLFQDANDVFLYRPPHVKDPDGGLDAPPYVYFQAKRNGYIRKPSSGSTLGLGDQEKTSMVPCIPYYNVLNSEGDPVEATGTCVPYAKTSYEDPNDSDIQIYEWFNPKTCQIVCCGLDGCYGLLRDADPDTCPGQMSEDPRISYLAEDMLNLAPEEDDNLTNFSKGTLDDWNERK